MIDELTKNLEEMPPSIKIGRASIPFTLKRASAKVWAASYEDRCQVWKEARGNTPIEAISKLKKRWSYDPD